MKEPASSLSPNYRRVSRGRPLGAADFDLDGRADLAAISDGSIIRLVSQTAGGGWLLARPGAAGVKNLKLAHGGEVEVAGLRYQAHL